MGRWSITALAINSVIGSGVFGLPSTIAALTGRASPIAVLLAGAIVGIIIACLAEVASRFSETGGPYLYARIAFGPFVGIQIGWMLWLAQITALAANANLFVSYLTEFWPLAHEPVARALTLTLLIGFLAAINVIGVQAGARLSNILTLAKLLPLLAVIAIGAVYLVRNGAAPAPPLHSNVDVWLQSLLLLVFAYGGFETALAPMGEARNPRRDAAFALTVALITCAVIYVLIQWVVVEVLADPAHSEHPLADVARVAIGPWAAAFVSAAALISLYGYLSAKILGVPRVTFALGERGDLPSFFAAVHPRFHTPYVSITIFSVFTWSLALAQSFAWNVTVSAVARLVYYAVVCMALPVLRAQSSTAPEFRLPAGNWLAALGTLLCLALLTRVNFSGSIILLLTVSLAFMNWLWVRNRAPHPSP
jgi:basic amino acid/polyamine antiporter, APA family